MSSLYVSGSKAWSLVVSQKPERSGFQPSAGNDSPPHIQTPETIHTFSGEDKFHVCLLFEYLDTLFLFPLLRELKSCALLCFLGRVRLNRSSHVMASYSNNQTRFPIISSLQCDALQVNKPRFLLII